MPPPPAPPLLSKARSASLEALRESLEAEMESIRGELHASQSREAEARVRCEALDVRHGLTCIPALTDDVHALRLVEQAAEAGAEDRLVVEEEDADRGHGISLVLHGRAVGT